MKVFKLAKRVLYKPKKHINENSKIIVFGEWFGNRCCDNCLYFANYVAETTSEFELYWIANESCNHERLNPSIKVLLRDSEDANQIINQARYIFVNQGLIDITSDKFFFPKNAYLINFWHGVAWKKIGLDACRGFFMRAYYKKLLKHNGTDYYLSTSKEFTRILKKSYCVKDRMIIESGYPRNSLFCKQEEAKKIKTDFCKKNNIPADSIIVSYLPTFRDTASANVNQEYSVQNPLFKEYLKSKKIYFINKSHYVNEQKQSDSASNDQYFLNSESLNASEIMAISNILITDYSSCFFDYLVLDRPIIHYLYDYDFYAHKDRGLYYEQKDVCCGDVSYNLEELIKAIEMNLDNPSKDKDLRALRRSIFMEYESSETNAQIYKWLLTLDGHHR